MDSMLRGLIWSIWLKGNIRLFEDIILFILEVVGCLFAICGETLYSL